MTTDIGKKNSTIMKTQINHRAAWISIILCCSIILTAAASFFALYRSSPVIRIKNALLKTLHSGSFSYAISQNGGVPATGAAELRLEEASINATYCQNAVEQYLYKNLTFTVQRETGKIIEYRDVTEIVQLVFRVLNGDETIKSAIEYINNTYFSGSIGAVFDQDELSACLMQYFLKLGNPAYMNEYFGYSKEAVQYGIALDFTPDLYRVLEDFANTVKPAFRQNSYYNFLYNIGIKGNKERLDALDIKMRIVVQNGYITKFLLNDGADELFLASFGEFGTAKFDLQKAEAYYRKIEEGQGT